MRKKEELRELKLKNFILLTIAGIINAFGITFFLLPVSLYDSGISGTSMFLSQVIPLDWMNLSFFLLVLNIPLFFFGYKKQGLIFTIYAIYSVIIYSLFAWLITDVFPVDVTNISPIAGNDLLLCSIFGGILSGIGSGLVMRYGGALDGIEVLAVIFSKKIGITAGSFVMAYNVILYVVCGIVFKSWQLPLYSIITYMAGLKTIDFIVEGIDRSKAVQIITYKQKEVCQALSETFEQGMTIINAKGYYSNTDTKMVYIVLNRFQINRMKDIVHSIDPKAYMSINEVADVFKADKA